MKKIYLAKTWGARPPRPPVVTIPLYKQFKQFILKYQCFIDLDNNVNTDTIKKLAQGYLECQIICKRTSKHL